MPCPYGTLFTNDYYYSMYMIRHDNEFIQFNPWEMIRYLVPTFINYFPRLIQNHRPINNLSEHAIMVERIDSHEISPFTRIIIPLQPDRMAACPPCFIFWRMTFVRIVYQDGLGKSRRNLNEPFEP